MMTRTRAATLGLLAPAAMALSMSADTSYRFLGERLGITNPWERGPLCGVAEAAILALTVYSWATRARGAAYLAYGIVLVQAVPAFAVSGGTGGIVRVALGPVLLALLLHLLLGLEIRMSGGRRDGIVRAALRELRERVTAYLGIGRRGEDSAAIARSRAADRAVSLAARIADADPSSRRYRRRTAALAAAIDAARHGLEGPAADAAEAAIVARIVRRKSAGDLARIDVRHDWTGTLTGRNTVMAQVPAGTEVVPEAEPVTVPQVPAQGVPQEVPGGTEAEPQAAEPVPASPVRGTAGRNSRNSRTPRPTVGPAETRPALAMVGKSGGTRADHIRALVTAGVTDTGTIRNTLAESGIQVPSDRYIRRIVGETRNPEVPATGTHGYM